MEKRKHNTVPFFLRLTVPPQWDQEGNTVLTPPRIWGPIAVSTPKSKQLPCPRLLLWTHHSYAECTLHTGDAAHPSSGKAKAVANCCLLQLCGFHTSLCVREMLKLLNIQEKNSRNLWWVNWISQDRLEILSLRLDATVAVNLWHQDLCRGFGALHDGLALGRGLSRGKYLKVPRGAWKTFPFVCKASFS